VPDRLRGTHHSFMIDTDEMRGHLAEVQ